MSSDADVQKPPEPTYRFLPYGEQQGSFMGVVASSNRDDGFFSGENNYIQHIIYTGFRYQCVEYARRFLLLTTGCIFANCGRASEIYKMDHITHVETGEKYKVIHCNNDGTCSRRPQPGDILVYNYHNELVPWGHVCIISYVDDTRVGIAEQNQHFGSFISPSPDYREGERCVARFVTLVTHEPAGPGAAPTYSLVEGGVLLPALGWMSYPDAPRREHIHAPFNPLPEMLAKRSSPYDDRERPQIVHVTMPEAVEIPTGPLQHIYFLRHGTGETSVGASTATARIVRLTLQMLFRRAHIGAGMAGLPSNPLNATITQDASTAALDAVFEAMRELGTETETGCEACLIAPLAKYFDIPEAWIAAMQREFSKGELHMCANATFAPCFPTDLDKQPVVEHPAENCDAVILPTVNLHDEAFKLVKLNFSTPRLLTELAQVSDVVKPLLASVAFMIPGYRAFAATHFRMDFGVYLKAVEERRGPRTAFTIVTCPGMDGLQRELIMILQSYCELFKYPVRVVAEEDLHYIDGKLYARPTDASPPISSPTVIAPLGDYEVNFVFAIAEWDDILCYGKGYDGKDPCKGEHAALYAAAVDPESDVAFAKPLWSFLCSGIANHITPAGGTDKHTEGMKMQKEKPLSIKFFDICRRLFELALPRQAANSWDQEVSEFKDSCRRIHLASEVHAELPHGGMVCNSAIINFAFSAFMGHYGYKPSEDRRAPHENNGIPACSAHMFSTEND